MPRLSLSACILAVGCAETVSAQPGLTRDAEVRDGSAEVSTHDGGGDCGPEDPRCSDLIDPGDQVVWVDRDVPRDWFGPYTEYNRHRHGVRLRPYRIGRFEVTIETYRECLRANRCPEWPVQAPPTLGGPPTDYTTAAQYRLHPAPLNYVTSLAVCRYLGGELPTRAQWQFAGHAGRPQRYPWGDTAACVGNFDKIHFSDPSVPEFFDCVPASRSPRTVRVDSHPEARGPFGSHHLLGNLGEFLALITETPESIAAQNRAGVFPFEARRELMDGEVVWYTGGYFGAVTELRLGVFAQRGSAQTASFGVVGARCVWEVAAP